MFKWCVRVTLCLVRIISWEGNKTENSMQIVKKPLFARHVFTFLFLMHKTNPQEINIYTRQNGSPMRKRLPFNRRRTSHLITIQPSYRPSSHNLAHHAIYFWAFRAYNFCWVVPTVWWSLHIAHLTCSTRGRSNSTSAWRLLTVRIPGHIFLSSHVTNKSYAWH